MTTERAHVDHPVCKKCKLHADCKSPFMKPTRCAREEKGQPRILVVGEAPGATEDKAGKPFVGQSGRMLRDYLTQTLGSLDGVFLTNSVRCLKGETRIDTDRGVRTIREIVKGKLRYRVCSYNRNTDSFVYQRITGFHQNTLGSRYWVKVTHEFAKKNTKGTVGAIVTNDHEFMTVDGKYVRADELDDVPINIGPHSYDKNASQILYGTLLGDSQISRNSASVEMSHCASQLEWIAAKARILGNCTLKHEKRKDGKGEDYVRARTKALRGIEKIRSSFYAKSGGRCVPSWLPSQIDWPLLATYFLDDGYTKSRKGGRRDLCEIACHRYTQKDITILIQSFESLGLSAYTGKKKNSQRVYFDAENSYKLLHGIARFVPPTMRYKLGKTVDNLPPYDDSFFRFAGYKPLYALATVVRADVKDATTYCIDVDGTANFITPAGVVHNCRPLNNKLETKKPVKLPLIKG